MHLWVWLQFELVFDDPRNIVLMLPPPEGKEWGRDGKVGKYCGDGLLGCRDVEV